MAKMTLTAYARLKNVTPQAIQHRIKRGTITERCLGRSNGKIVTIDSILADNDFKKYGDPVQVAAQAAAKAEEKNQKLKAQEVPPETNEEIKPPGLSLVQDGNPPPLQLVNPMPPSLKPVITKEIIQGKEVPVETVDYNDDFHRFKKAKATTEELRARKIEFEILELEGKLVDIDEVKAVIAKLVTETKDAILNVPTKVGPELLACSDLVELENKLLAALNDALSNLSRVTNVQLGK